MKRTQTRTKALVLSVFLTLPLLSIATRSGAADPPKAPPSPEPSVWMKQKLAASHNVLTALTKEDYESIQANAKTMLMVGFLEKFVRADAPGYREMLGDFQYANKALILASKEKNLDGATVAYVQLTISCVNCHKIVRDGAKPAR